LGRFGKTASPVQNAKNDLPPTTELKDDAHGEYAVGNRDIFHARTWEAYADGSGGSAAGGRVSGASEHSISRGVGGNWSIGAAGSGPLSGHVQTVPRRELMAMIKVLSFAKQLEFTGQINLHIDPKTVARSYNSRCNVSIRGRAEWKGANGDLRGREWELVRARAQLGCATTVTKVDAHKDAFEVSIGQLTRVELFGDHVADQFADVAAARHVVSRAQAELYKRVAILNENF
jgi:ribonuclease HI